MKNVYILLAVVLSLLLIALVAYFVGPMLELRGVPADIQALYLRGTQAKWRMIAALIAVVAALVALLTGILWLNVRKQK
ncbi:MAG TPA: hypothetical protein VGB73_02910 [Pyrinomonadaceae bacterium]|jgi:H+/Cl- antiporter ClcA